MNNNEFVLHPVASSAYFKQSEATESSGASNKFSDDCFEDYCGYPTFSTSVASDTCQMSCESKP